MKFVNVGFGNMVSAERIVVISSYDSAPMKRLVQDAKESGSAIDVTCGKKTKTVIITDSDHVILSPVTPETVTGRMEKADGGKDEEDNL